MRHLSTLHFFTVAFAAVALGCGGHGSGPDVTETDSAGVKIVVSSGPSWAEGQQWNLSSQPRLVISPQPDDPEATLYEVVGLLVLPDGRVVVANRGDDCLLLYSAGGERQWKVGRGGDGPSEFRDLRGLALVGEEIWAYQRLPFPIKVFGLDGHFVRSMETLPLESASYVRGVLADGSLIVRGRPHGTPSGKVWTEFTSLLRFRNGIVDTIATLPHTKRVDLGRMGQEWQALGPALHVAVGQGRVFAGFSAEWDIGIWNQDGRLTRRLRRAWEPTPLKSEDQAAYREGLKALGRAEPGLEQAYGALANAMVFPEHHAAHARLVVDESGVLWVQRPQTQPPWSEGLDYTPVPPDARSWDLFHRDGAWLGTVSLPARFRVMHIGLSHVAGVWKDEWDVEHVQVWDLHKPN
ncbi:MAG: hypothetical protein PVJ76_08515 [Gemmatimonadota bacterium]|jgi:hypothetical protein